MNLSGHRIEWLLGFGLALAWTLLNLGDVLSTISIDE